MRVPRFRVRTTMVIVVVAGLIMAGAVDATKILRRFDELESGFAYVISAMIGVYIILMFSVVVLLLWRGWDRLGNVFERLRIQPRRPKLWTLLGIAVASMLLAEWL